MKALILAGGKGTRLKPLTATTVKHLLPVANRPILFYALQQITEASIKDIGIIVSPETATYIKEAVGDGSRWNASITYIPQAEPLGLAHAVKTAQGFLEDSPFLLFLGDNLIQGGVTRFVEEFNRRSPDALIILKAVKETHLYGIAELDETGRVSRVEEKPKHTSSNLAVIGVYLFSPLVHQAIARIKPSWRGELEITDAVQEMIGTGNKVHSCILEGWWFDTGKKDDILAANQAVLNESLTRDIRGKVDAKSQVAGRVEIGKGSHVENSTIQGPTAIAENCQIRNSLVGPFTSLGAGTRIEDSSIERSVVLDGSRISHIERLQDSLIGSRVELKKAGKTRRTVKLFIGDDARLEL